MNQELTFKPTVHIHKEMLSCDLNCNVTDCIFCLMQFKANSLKISSVPGVIEQFETSLISLVLPT